MKRFLVAAFIAAVVSTPCFAVEYYLRADTLTKTMPGGVDIPMWGFAQDTSFGALDGQVTVPGPLLTVPEGDPNLIIHLDNNLTVPVSIVINGQIAKMTPVRNPDGRVHSFTHETAPGNTTAVDYVWTSFKPGTFIYQSGTHPAVQVQMGLYGGITKNFSVGQAYQDVNYVKQVPLFFSEIDPDLHNAVATGNYGPGKAVTSTIDYEPKYFLINGQAYSGSSVPVLAGRTNQKILLRFFNMGIETRSPLLQGLYMKSVAEDGNPYQYPKESYTLPLTAAKTIDAVITSPTMGRFPLYDRRLALTNAAQSSGGMLIYLDITYNPDFNNDQFVNLLDYVILAAEFGRTDCSPGSPCQADLNADGQVNTVDLALWSEWWLTIP
jgi:FtsP/CotA-like multicopper oxidase with cupredoxin domain